MSEKLKQLQAPFAAADIEWRAQSVGFDSNGKPYAMVLAYVTNRAIQQRLDETFGIDKWKNEFMPAPDGGVMCGISIKFDEWVTKYDAAPNTDIESVKGGISNAMKRAAVQWGIGRYLYNLEVQFAECSETKQKGKEWVQAYDKKTNKKFWWKVPTLPIEALPKDDKTQSIAAEGEYCKDDSQATVKQQSSKITKEQIAELQSLITETSSDNTKLLAYFKVDKIENMTMDVFEKAKIELNRKIKNKRQQSQAELEAEAINPNN